MQKIDHIGFNVPDVEAALAYYDQLMPLLGYKRFYPQGYVPTDWDGAQVFIYPAVEEGNYSRLKMGLSHIGFSVPTRDDVHRVHQWALDRGHEILNAPRAFPEYGDEFYGTYFVDQHGFMIEAACHMPPADTSD